MHMVIYALVEASTQDEALSTVKTVFDQLVGADLHTCAVFDYYVTFAEESCVAGKARWGNLPVAAPIDSGDGQDLLDRGWTATRDEFHRHLDRAREAIEELSPEAIMRDEDLARHAFHQVGAYRGPSVFFYTQHGMGVRHRDHLDRLLEESEDLWIVPADVHY